MWGKLRRSGGNGKFDFAVIKIAGWGCEKTGSGNTVTDCVHMGKDGFYPCVGRADVVCAWGNQWRSGVDRKADLFL